MTPRTSQFFIYFFETGVSLTSRLNKSRRRGRPKRTPSRFPPYTSVPPDSKGPVRTRESPGPSGVTGRYRSRRKQEPSVPETPKGVGCPGLSKSNSDSPLWEGKEKRGEDQTGGDYDEPRSCIAITYCIYSVRVIVAHPVTGSSVLSLSPPPTPVPTSSGDQKESPRGLPPN